MVSKITELAGYTFMIPKSGTMLGVVVFKKGDGLVICTPIKWQVFMQRMQKPLIQECWIRMVRLWIRQNLVATPILWMWMAIILSIRMTKFTRAILILLGLVVSPIR